MDDKLRQQFSLRARDFDGSARWITDERLIACHTALAGKPSSRLPSKALDLCCGTGRMGIALLSLGWDVRGVDICPDMVAIASRHFPVREGKAEKIPYADGEFGLVVCRQTFQFLQSQEALAEISRVLAPGGSLVISLTVPFSSDDSPWLYEIHRVKQPLLRTFYDEEALAGEIMRAGFVLRETRRLQVRESVTRWMRFAPELTPEVKRRVIEAVENAPEPYRSIHKVGVADGEVFEDWNWVVILAAKG